MNSIHITSLTFFCLFCFSTIAGFEFALIVAEAILLGTTAFYCYATKEVPGTLNEAQNNLKCK